MQVLIIGGTGLISTGIVKHLLARGADVTVFNRAQRESVLTGEVKRLTGDRNQFDEFERRFADARFDVVIETRIREASLKLIKLIAIARETFHLARQNALALRAIKNRDIRATCQEVFDDPRADQPRPANN